MPYTLHYGMKKHRKNDYIVQKWDNTEKRMTAEKEKEKKKTQL